ncbi:hypothetical protein IVA88_13125 [Bradyrhizobium sp. 149]|uniref:hypothetical protein n=1 Tax=Bradyrhizobium sp. 149 TaxID=2782624 RepID=UPI001FF9715E|nr:hypothetical protein [Bradyrhizobium sp. 149]MCK1652371.1 hypothetical protein [Bradyrhizobium sp. 149]
MVVQTELVDAGGVIVANARARLRVLDMRSSYGTAKRAASLRAKIECHHRACFTEVFELLDRLPAA